jgi:hypothetical protein
MILYPLRILTGTILFGLTAAILMMSLLGIRLPDFFYETPTTWGGWLIYLSFYPITTLATFFALFGPAPDRYWR